MERRIAYGMKHGMVSDYYYAGVLFHRVVGRVSL